MASLAILAAGGAPIRGHGQAAAKVARIGVLMHDGTPPGFPEAFRAGLEDFGYVEGKNVLVELRSAEGRSDQLTMLAKELVGSRVDVIVALNTPAAVAAKNATTAIPIVMARVSDPVASGLVASLARPGGNVTGLSFNNSELALKGLEVLRQALPYITRVAVLSNADNPAHRTQVAAMVSVGERTNFKVFGVAVSGSQRLASAFQDIAKLKVGAIFVLDDTALTRQRIEIIRLAAERSLPVVTRYADFAEAGAILSYGPSLPVLYRRTAYYVDKLLRGARASDLPLEEPSVFDFVVNVRAASALGLTIAPSVLLRADRVIR